ncbi:hypothetical protein M8360_32015, partial [Klebsiella pneumoniae]|nr:hypothetical protein [Klebsiella pneumoniae]
SVLMIVSKVVGTALNEAADPDGARTEDDGPADRPSGDGDDTGIGAVVKSNFGTALMLGIAYSASIGSLGTIIGTPPNLFLIGYLKDNHD